MVKVQTQQRIARAIEEVGYVPNLSARSLASNRSNVVAVIVPAIDNPAYSEMVRGLSDRLRKNNVGVIIGNTEHRSEAEHETLLSLMAHRPGGIVLTGIQKSERVRRLISEWKIPTVETWELGSDQLDMTVGFDNAAALRAVGHHLVEQGYRKLLVVSDTIAKYSRLEQRLFGLQEATNGTSATICDTIFEMPAQSVSGAEAVARIVGDQLEVDALVCFGDVYAIGAVLACMRRGLRVPQDLAVTGFGDFEHAPLLSPSLTTVRVPARAIGECAADLLLRKMSGQRVETNEVDVGYELVIRESS